MTTKKTETKESVAVPAIRKIGDPGVIAIGGVIQEPVAQVAKVAGRITHNDVLLTDYNFTLIGDKAAKLSIYAYSVRVGAEAKAINLFIVADELSSLDLETPRYMDYHDTSFAVITLVNSSSKNDYYRGSTVLVNVESEHNGFENSKIELGNVFYGYRKTSPGDVFIPKRVKVENVCTYDLQYQGNSLPPGNYQSSEIIETTFVRGERDEDKRVYIIDSDLRWCNFREGDIDIRKSKISHCGFHFTGPVKLHKVNLENEYFGNMLPGINLSSKFDLTDIEIAGSAPARMIRVDDDNVLITLPGDRKEARFNGHDLKLMDMSFRNPHSRRALRNKASEMLFGDVCPSETEESVLDYLVDTVLSRCGMMNLMDTAQRLLSNDLMVAKERPKAQMPWAMGPRTAEIYGGGLGVAKEHDNTIYIDGNNFGKF